MDYLPLCRHWFFYAFSVGFVLKGGPELDEWGMVLPKNHLHFKKI
jgi:hypothetical protein